MGLCGTQPLSTEEVTLLEGQQQSLLFPCPGPSLDLEWLQQLFHFTLQLACYN